ncbi:adenosylcobinamide-phosphate synthase CbiB [Suipraeoptans intestinalis]|uniref:adenosylcobinamide-phosphate synthase CbiB n=1 Tax=Suipraeoptans intestinalis TaxID=2606628 RepID=UPI002A755C9A|nr:adenosylcobinamide-phosphate synthase CbiB [Suipraeoptans intestinalis]MDY3121685.1 adenosylcobinamide-phosphate synthase CbiB [Suipraeoptans intestinalis]
MNEWWRMLLPLCVGVGLDLLLGDPVWLYHPVRLMGKTIEGLGGRIRACLPKTKTGERAGGGLLVILMLLIWGVLPFFFVSFCYRLHWGLGLGIESVMCYQMLAMKSLRTESRKVYDALKTGIEPARKAVAMIVGRDTANLTEEGVIKAAVETVAENTSDGVVAPLLFLCIGGGAGGYLYKAVNTMDSMVGYQNDTYRYFGSAAARLDDLLNYLPARISAGLMLLAAYFLGMPVQEGVRIYRRDRRKHKSPNAAQTEAVMAGVLQVQLAGDAWYFGKKYEKPTIGDPIRAIMAEDILRAHKLLYGTGILAAVLAIAVRGCLWGR